MLVFKCDVLYKTWFQDTLDSIRCFSYVMEIYNWSDVNDSRFCLFKTCGWKYLKLLYLLGPEHERCNIIVVQL